MVYSVKEQLQIESFEFALVLLIHCATLSGPQVYSLRMQT